MISVISFRLLSGRFYVRIEDELTRASCVSSSAHITSYNRVQVICDLAQIAERAHSPTARVPSFATDSSLAAHECLGILYLSPWHPRFLP
jgi:hypothetical protein